jgi:hypothetical protein
MSNLEFTLSGQGKLFEAEEILRLVLQLQEKVLGNKDQHGTAILTYIALVLSRQGKHVEAVQRCSEVVELLKAVLGAEYPIMPATITLLKRPQEIQNRSRVSDWRKKSKAAIPRFPNWSEKPSTRKNKKEEQIR